jgi:hypothetical protein
MSDAMLICGIIAGSGLLLVLRLRNGSNDTGDNFADRDG